MFNTNRRNINFKIVARLLGILLMIESAFMGISLGICYIYGEYNEVPAFIYSILITLGFGAAMTFLTPHKDNNMGKREGILLTGLTWVVFSLFGSLPFIFGGTKMTLAAAFFETMSGFTTTGASVIENVESVSHGILMWRAITHLLGGMGIILFTLAVIPMLNKSSGIQLFNAEVTGITHDKLRPRISHTAKGLWMVYVALSGTLIILLWAGPMNLFDAICHSFSAISTGGFSTKNASIEAYNSDYVKIVITIFMYLSGINFALMFNAAMGNVKPLFKNDTVRWFTLICVIAFVLIATDLYIKGDYDDIPSLFIDTNFQILSAITTTGFTGSNYTEWQGLPIVVIMLIMIIGSCAGSTAGGMKVDRIILTVKNLHNELYKILHPNTIIPLRVNGKVMQTELISKTCAFMMIFFILILAGTTVLISFDISILDALFAVMSCAGNDGLGYGLTGSNFGTIPDPCKWVLSGVMLIGRLEIFTIIVIFTKAFWNKE